MTNTALQNVHMEEFIEEVRQRPAIYDTTKAEYCDRSLKRHLWMEICEKFNPDWQTLEEEQREAIGREMKNRWKSIRDAFVREVRYLKEAAKFGEPPAKKRKYIYYDQLSFLLPTVGSRSNTTVNKIHNFPPLHATTGHFLHNTSYDDSYSEEALDLKKEPQEPVTNLQEVDLQETQSESDRESSVFGGRINNLTQKSNNILRDELTNNKEDKINIWLNWNSKENNDPREPQEEKVEVVPIIDNMVTHQTSHESENNNSSTNSVYDGYGITADSDYMFLMSLLPSFKKLGDETKSMIKIEIASVLHNAIYGPRRFSEQLLLQENVRRMVKTPNKKV